MIGAVSADAWVQAAAAAGVGIIALAAGGFRRWAGQIRDTIEQAQVDMIRVSDQARRDNQHALAVISSQVHDIFGQLDDTRQRLARVEAVVGQPARSATPGMTYQPVYQEPKD